MCKKMYFFLCMREGLGTRLGSSHRGGNVISVTGRCTLEET